jgi:hypothetical protein
MAYPVYTRDMILPSEFARANIVSFVVCLIATIVVAYRNVKIAYLYAPLMIWLSIVLVFLTDFCAITGQQSVRVPSFSNSGSTSDINDCSAIKMVLKM